MRENAIKIKALYKTYSIEERNIDVLKNINLNIERGEFVSIMGPSGSGKSTLLYMMGALDKVTSGSIIINGKEITKMTDKEASMLRRNDLGFVFQSYNLVSNLDVEENISLPILLDNKKVGQYKKKINELMEILGLSDRRKHKPRQLSGGQQQRVAIGRALINEPDIILADEPIGNLDTETGIEIMKLLKELNKKEGKTIVQVTHSKEASEFSDRIIQIKDGVVL